ncbi:NADase-type glycan-binding domain-containing protein [Streptomyces morookaense]|uniref:NAD glycohydrolase translocation F5/8 type C domain-containing protein n=1 Tax=Streptomyces morookaense TaxID=1970 RepID=A0A7Y7E7Y9_STRMO|nr:hypothetical protein [Streptomyces morookaense]NVK78899.1 hypothetical protein [Streptomyces morookaense]GHF35898.1 hypothetical protein GCM10010359_43310 [Streptomyces morookaense]
MGTDSSAHRGWYVPGEQDVCGSCGVVAYPGETFCISCGAYRGWDRPGSGQPAQPPAAAFPAERETVYPQSVYRQSVPAETAQPDSGQRGFVQPEFGAARPTGQGASAPVSPRPADPQPAAGNLSWADPLFAPLPGTPEPHSARTQVISGEVVLWTTPAEDGPDAPTPPGGVPQLLQCPECGGPNTEARTYCHPCGALLRPEPEPEEPQPTRWERLRERYFDRPEVWHWDRRWGVALAALPLCLVAGVSAGGAVAAAHDAVPRIKDRFLAQDAVAPDAVSASSSTKGFEAELASDGVDNRAWAPKGSGKDAVGQYWTAEFTSPFRLTSLLIINGAAKAPKQFAETGRPTRIKVTATTAGHGTVEKQIELGGQPGPQRFDLGIDDVVQVQVTIEAVNPGLKPDMPVAMAEIQFFTRQAS